MTEKKKLYPMRFHPIVFDRPWGRETWTAADLGFADSEVENGWLSGNTMSDIMETYLERVVGENVYGFYGRQFPVSVRFMDIRGDMPVTVHPDDAVAMERYDALGNAKLWYVREASADSRLYIGFRKDVPASEFYEKCMDGSVRELMNEVTPVKGGYYFIEPGLVHAASGKMKIVCVCESSEADFTLFDPNDAAADRQMQMLRISESLDFIKLDAYIPAAEGATAAVSSANADGTSGEAAKSGVVDNLVERPEFNVARINLSDPLHIYTEKFESFIVYVCVEGEMSVQVPVQTASGGTRMEDVVVSRDEAVLIPAELPDFFLVPRECSTVLLEVVTRPAEEVDGYINPDTEPFLEGEDYGGLESGEFDDESEEE